MLVGLMEPVHRYPEAAQARLFARNIIARLFGNFVVFSPSFDSEVMPLAHEVGRAAREATAVHLITQHPGTPWNQPTPTFSDRYYDQPYLDIAAVQTGHNGDTWIGVPIMPSSGICTSIVRSPTSRSSTWRPCTTPRATRDGGRWMRAGWVGEPGSPGVWLHLRAGDLPPKVPQGSGAIWKWVTDPEKYDYWKKALQWESAFQMQYLHDFLPAIEWWRLEPAHDLIRNQPEDVTRHMVLAKTPAGDLAVAYLPDNEAIEIDVSVFPGTAPGPLVRSEAWRIHRDSRTHRELGTPSLRAAGEGRLGAATGAGRYVKPV